MLILTRRAGESTLIGEDITVTVLRIKGKDVQIGVDAPSETITRQTGEWTYIGEDITVKLLGVRAGQARLGITAPKEIPVHREEVYERIRQEQELIFRPKEEKGARFTVRVSKRQRIEDAD